MRPRRSWSFYGSSLYLECLIDPHSSSLHELIRSNDYTFLIGNHSDELTPWLPVLARRCSCDVFLLPCCFFDFGGRKFLTHKQDDATQYEQYLAYIEKISHTLDLTVERDKLRIPSTKNICFNLHLNKYRVDLERIIHLFFCLISSNLCIRTCLMDQFGVDIDLQHADPQIPNHRPSSTKAKPEFYSVKFEIIKFLFQHLLVHRNSLTLSTAYDLLPNELCEPLKSENGGLKSIILSYRHALDYNPQTKLITLVNPHSNTITRKQSAKVMLKSKPCFFDAFHPDGCPLADEQCAFSHCKK